MRIGEQEMEIPENTAVDQRHFSVLPVIFISAGILLLGVIILLLVKRKHKN